MSEIELSSLAGMSSSEYMYKKRKRKKKEEQLTGNDIK